jgi:hypothetical protein
MSPGVGVPLKRITRWWKEQNGVFEKAEPNDKKQRTQHHTINEHNKQPQHYLAHLHIHNRPVFEIFLATRFL